MKNFSAPFLLILAFSFHSAGLMGQVPESEQPSLSPTELEAPENAAASEGTDEQPASEPEFPPEIVELSPLADLLGQKLDEVAPVFTGSQLVVIPADSLPVEHILRDHLFTEPFILAALGQPDLKVISSTNSLQTAEAKPESEEEAKSPFENEKVKELPVGTPQGPFYIVNADKVIMGLGSFDENGRITGTLLITEGEPGSDERDITQSKFENGQLRELQAVDHKRENMGRWVIHDEFGSLDFYPPRQKLRVPVESEESEEAEIEEDVEEDSETELKMPEFRTAELDRIEYRSKEEEPGFRWQETAFDTEGNVLFDVEPMTLFSLISGDTMFENEETPQPEAEAIEIDTAERDAFLRENFPVITFKGKEFIISAPHMAFFQELPGLPKIHMYEIDNLEGSLANLPFEKESEFKAWTLDSILNLIDTSGVNIDVLQVTFIDDNGFEQVIKSFPSRMNGLSPERMEQMASRGFISLADMQARIQGQKNEDGLIEGIEDIALKEKAGAPLRVFMLTPLPGGKQEWLEFNMKQTADGNAQRMYEIIVQISLVKYALRGLRQQTSARQMLEAHTSSLEAIGLSESFEEKNSDEEPASDEESGEGDS